MSDSVTSLVGKLMADAGGLGLSLRPDLVASVGLKGSGGLAATVARLGLAATGPSLASFGVIREGPTVAAVGLTATGGLGEAVTRALGVGRRRRSGGLPPS